MLSCFGATIDPAHLANKPVQAATLMTEGFNCPSFDSTHSQYPWAVVLLPRPFYGTFLTIIYENKLVKQVENETYWL